MENFNLKKFLVENKLTASSKIISENEEEDSYFETSEEGMDFGTGSEIQAVINHLIDNDRQDILDVLGKIPAWNTLVDQASDI